MWEFLVIDMVERRAEVVARLKSLEEAAAPLVSFLLNPSAVQELRADKQYNLQMLKERYQVVIWMLKLSNFVKCYPDLHVFGIEERKSYMACFIRLVQTRLRLCISTPSFSLNVGTILVLLIIFTSTGPCALTLREV